MRRVLVTGGTGFVGASLVRRLLLDGHEVHLLVRSGYDPWRIEAIRSELRFHEADLSERESLGKLLERIRPNWILHLAANGNYFWQTNDEEILRTNLLGTIRLVEAALACGFEALVHAGSSSEYGFKDHPPSETEWLEPNSYYAVTKASATQFCRFVAQSRQVPISTLRLYSVYGPWEDPRRLIPTLIREGLQGRLPPLVAPETARDYVFVEDVVDAFLLAAGAAATELGAVYNVGTGIQISMREVVELVRRLFGIRAEPRWGSMPGRVWDTATWVADCRRIRSELGWSAKTDLPTGLRETLAWFQESQTPGPS